MIIANFVLSKPKSYPKAETRSEHIHSSGYEAHEMAD